MDGLQAKSAGPESIGCPAFRQMPAFPAEAKATSANGLLMGDARHFKSLILALPPLLGTNPEEMHLMGHYQPR
jgi:hypothetical protein